MQSIHYPSQRHGIEELTLGIRFERYGAVGVSSRHDLAISHVYTCDVSVLEPRELFQSFGMSGVQLNCA